VGTPDYIAPEVLRKVGYGPEADLWGVGCVLFEMLCGFPPFFSDDAHTTCRKIVQWRSYLKFPSDVHVEPQAQSLIRQLLCDGADRLTIAGCKVTGYLLRLLLQLAAAFPRLSSRAFHMFEAPSAAIIYHTSPVFPACPSPRCCRPTHFSRIFPGRMSTCCNLPLFRVSPSHARHSCVQS
jgi:serine/threonine protein kinase